MRKKAIPGALTPAPYSLPSHWTQWTEGHLVLRTTAQKTCLWVSRTPQTRKLSLKKSPDKAKVRVRDAAIISVMKHWGRSYREEENWENRCWNQEWMWVGMKIMVERRGHQYCQRTKDHFYEAPDKLMASGMVGCVSYIILFTISQSYSYCAKRQVEAASLFRVCAF